MKTIKILSLIIFPVITTILAESSEILINFDGANGMLFNMEYPEESQNRFSVIYGNPLDQYPYAYFSILKNPLTSSPVLQDSLHRVQIYGSLGSEVGEILLNKFNGETGANRDHSTNLGIAWKPKNSSLKFYYTQRYIDTYSDGYDSLWQDFSGKNDGESMFNDGEGLIHDQRAGYIFENEKVVTAFSFSSYGFWGATPFFYNPIYKSGYLMTPVVRLNLASSELTIDGDIDVNSEYQNHIDGVDYNDANCNISWFKPFGGRSSAEINYYRDTKIKALWKVGGQISDTLDGVYSLNLSGSFYGTLKPEASFKFNLLKIPRVTVSAEAAMDYHEEERSYSFMNNRDTVRYSNYDYYEPKFHISAAYHDTLFFPANLKIWYDYSFKRSWESVEWIDGYKMSIVRDTIGPSPLTGQFGFNGNYLITYKFMKFNLWGGMVITPKNSNIQYSLPYQMGIDIEFGERDSTGLFGGLYFDTREQLVLRYFNVNENKVMDFTSPARTGVSLKARVPFLLPFWRNKLKTAIELDAGPIRFAKEQRLKEHPLGNDYGPTISLAIKASLN